MKINQKHETDQMLYCLSSRRHFRTIVELVSFYERNDLGENFAGCVGGFVFLFCQFGFCLTVSIDTGSLV